MITENSESFRKSRACLNRLCTRTHHFTFSVCCDCHFRGKTLFWQNVTAFFIQILQFVLVEQSRLVTFDERIRRTKHVLIIFCSVYIVLTKVIFVLGVLFSSPSLPVLNKEAFRRM